jgi:hypothetical protein
MMLQPNFTPYTSQPLPEVADNSIVIRNYLRRVAHNGLPGFVIQTASTAPLEALLHLAGITTRAGLQIRITQARTAYLPSLRPEDASPAIDARHHAEQPWGHLRTLFVASGQLRLEIFAPGHLAEAAFAEQGQLLLPDQERQAFAEHRINHDFMRADWPMSTVLGAGSLAIYKDMGNITTFYPETPEPLQVTSASAFLYPRVHRPPTTPLHPTRTIDAVPVTSASPTQIVYN